MGQKEIKQGQIVYLSNGESARYVCEVSRGHFVIQEEKCLWKDGEWVNIELKHFESEVFLDRVKFKKLSDVEKLIEEAEKLIEEAENKRGEIVKNYQTLLRDIEEFKSTTPIFQEYWNILSGEYKYFVSGISPLLKTKNNYIIDIYPIFSGDEIVFMNKEREKVEPLKDDDDLILWLTLHRNVWGLTLSKCVQIISVFPNLKDSIKEIYKELSDEKGQSWEREDNFIENWLNSLSLIERRYEE